jgi:hypothetical protein
MSVRKGTSRVVILLEPLGIALKFPRIGVSGAMQSVKRVLKRPTRFRRELLQPIDTPYTFNWWLLRGVKDNLRERSFYRTTHHPICQPTYFSIAGLLNIQQFGHPLKIDSGTFKTLMLRMLGEETFWSDSHHFSQPNNFCQAADGLRMMDYANRRTQWIIRKQGDDLRSGYLALATETSLVPT